MRYTLASTGLVCGVLLCSAAYGQTTDITGLYEVQGRQGAGTYKGAAEVSKDGDVYRVIWTIGSERFAGTGFVTDGVFSVVYVANRQTRPGLVSYRIGTDGSLEGRYTILGSKSLLTENWRRGPRT